MTYTRAEADKCLRCGDVTPNGVIFDWSLVNAMGASFTLIREDHHTDDDIREAKAYLRRERDVVGLHVSSIKG